MIEIGTLVCPDVIARTVELRRGVISAPEGFEISMTPTEATATAAVNPDLKELRRYYQEFWTEFLEQLWLDDPGQPRPNLPKSTNIFFSLSTKNAWVSAHFAKSSQLVGVYFGCSNNQSGRERRDLITVGKWRTLEPYGPGRSYRCIPQL